MNSVFAIRVKCDKTIPAKADLGLYAVAGGSEFRWSECKLTNTVDTWKDGFISVISEIAKKGNFQTGGGMVYAEGFSVTAYNNSQLTIKLEELGISLTGLVCEILEFDGADTEPDINIYTHYTGVIEDVTMWNELKMSFNVKTARHKRRSNLGAIFNGKEIIPITYGSSDPANGRYFKYLRTEFINEKIKVSDFALAQGDTNCYPPTMYLFPITEKVSDLEYKVRLGFLSEAAFPIEQAYEFFIGKWIKIVEGASDNVGKYRLITNAIRQTVGDTLITIKLSEYTPVPMAGNYTGTEVEQTWIEFYDLKMGYAIDIQPIGGFIGSETLIAETGKSEIYAKADEELIRILPYNCDVSVNGASLVVTPTVLSGAVDQVSSFYIMPVRSIAYYLEPDLDGWTEGLHLSRRTPINGLYSNSDSFVDGTDIDLVAETGIPANVLDKNKNTNWSRFFKITTSTNSLYYAITYTVKLPKLPKDVDFSNVYLGVNLISSSVVPSGSQGAGNIIVSYRSYINRLKKPISLTEDNVVYYSNPDGVLFDDVPDFYYSEIVDTNNKNFHTTAIGNDAGKFNTGYRNYNLNISSKEEYENIEELLIMVYKTYTYTVSGRKVDDTTTLTEVSIMLERVAKLDSEVYA